MPQVNHNGEWKTDKEIHLQTDNRGFFYGDGFFETIRLINGKPVHLDDHLDRMIRSFQFLQMIPPFALEKSVLSTLLEELAEMNRVVEGGRVRITFYRESGGFYTPNTDKCSYLIQCSPFPENQFELNRNGIHLTLYTQNLKPLQPLYSLKTLNSLLYVLAGIYARNNSCDDALIMNDHENIIESTSSNLFIVKKETIITPGIDEGCIPGVMRSNVLKIIENKTGYRLERRNISLKDVMEADELFLTNAIKGIQWVVAFRDKRYYHNISVDLAGILKAHSSGI